MENTALLIIDMQNDYFPGGKMALPGSEAAAKTTAKLLTKFREKQWPIIHIQHRSIQEGSILFLPNTEGQKIHEDIKPKEGETVIEKIWPNSFKDTGLLEALTGQNIKRLIITGMMTFMCIDATTRAAMDLGFECTIIHDATATPPVEFNGISCTAEQAQAVILSAMAFISCRVTGSRDVIDA